MIDYVSAELNGQDFELFRSLHAESISHLYPYSSALTAESFIRQHQDRIDRSGYFTLRKTIWKAVYKNCSAAFTVVTEKRGGSIKFGPTMVVPCFRNQGVGSQSLYLRKQAMN